MKIFRYLLLFLVLSLGSCENFSARNDMRIEFHASFQSAFVEARNVEVLLPAGYTKDQQYDVVYMHDGQNVFNPKTAYTGIAWEADKSLEKLLAKDKIRPAILVAIWNSPRRRQEYMPNQPKNLVAEKALELGWEGEILSDAYLKFMVYELKPFIDSIYSTFTGPDNTFVMGSSMGGLISFYALVQYPDVFGGAACISTHWPALDGIFVDQVPKLIPEAGKHRLYFDYGTTTLDSLYEPFQLRVDEMVREAGFARGKDWTTLRFEGAEHNENSWRKRVHIPLEFLLRKSH